MAVKCNPQIEKKETTFAVSHGTEKGIRQEWTLSGLFATHAEHDSVFNSKTVLTVLL